MPREISLGLMEQSLMRQEHITDREAAEIKEVLDRVTHVEGKYLKTLERLRERVETLGGGKPLILHAQYPTRGDDILNLTNPAFKDQLGAEFAGIIDAFDPEWFSFHLGFSCEELLSGGQFDFTRCRSAVLPEKVVRERIIESMTFVKETYLKRGEVILENLDYNPTDKSGAYEYVCEPGFIDEILTVTDSRMLLDFGHANCSAQNMGYSDVMSFIFELPLEKVLEVHMSGAGRKDGLAHDTHHAIHREGQPEIIYFEEALKSGRMTGLAAVTLETFEDVFPQLDLLQMVLERNGFGIAGLQD